MRGREECARAFGGARCFRLGFRFAWAVAAPTSDQHRAWTKRKASPSARRTLGYLCPAMGSGGGVVYDGERRRKATEDTRWSRTSKSRWRGNKNPLTAAHLDEMDGVAKRSRIANTGVLRSGRECVRRGAGEGRKAGVSGGLSCSRW